MIAVTIKEILDSSTIFQDISKKELRARTAFKIARIIKAIENAMKDFDEAKMGIFKKYGELDDDGNLKIENKNIKIKKEYINDYNQEMAELLNTQIQLCAEPINIDELDAMTFTPAQLFQFAPFIIE